MESSALGPHPPSLSLALANYKALKDFPYRPTAKPPSQKKMVGSHGSLPRLRRSGSRGSLGLSVASQCAAVIFGVIPVSCPQGCLTVWEGGRAILTPVQQARSGSRPHGLAPLAVILVWCRESS